MIPTDLASVAVPNMTKTDAGCNFVTLMILNILIGIESVCKDMIKKLIGMYVRFLLFNYLSS